MLTLTHRSENLYNTNTVMYYNNWSHFEGKYPRVSSSHMYVLGLLVHPLSLRIKSSVLSALPSSCLRFWLSCVWFKLNDMMPRNKGREDGPKSALHTQAAICCSNIVLPDRSSLLSPLWLSTQTQQVSNQMQFDKIMKTVELTKHIFFFCAAFMASSASCCCQQVTSEGSRG